MDLERKVAFLVEELSQLKREGAKLSDDARKAIIYDVLEKSKERRHRSLTIFSAFIAIVISLAAYIGFDAVKKSTADMLVNSEMKKQIITELSKEKEASLEAVESAERLTSLINHKDAELDEKYRELEAQVSSKLQSLERMSNLMINIGLSNQELKMVLGESMLKAVEDSNIFIFMRSFGISEVSVLKLIGTETEGLNYQNLTQEGVSANVKQLQRRYSLTTDGALGPCTSLVISALLLESYELETRKELENSSFRDKSWLVKSFQTCSREDKEQIRRNLDYPDLPLHRLLNKFIEVAGMKREELILNLQQGMPVPMAHEALEHIGYEKDSF